MEYEFLWLRLEAGEPAIEAMYVKGLLRRFRVLEQEARTEKAVRENLQRDLQKATAENSRMRARLAATESPIHPEPGQIFNDKQGNLDGVDPIEFAQIGNQALQVLDQLRAALPSLEQFQGYLSTWIKFTTLPRGDYCRSLLRPEPEDELAPSTAELWLSIVVFLNPTSHDESDRLGAALRFSSAIAKANLHIPFVISTSKDSREAEAMDRGFYPFHRVGPKFVIGVD